MRDLCVGSASARTALCTHTCTPSAEQSALSPHMHRIALPDATGSARTGTWETARGGGAEGGAVALALRRAGSVFARSIQASYRREKEPMEEAREISPKLVEAAGARRWTSGPGGAGRQTGYSRCQSARRVRAAHADRAFLRDRQGQVPT